MASRIKHSATKSKGTAKISIFPELPGAVFVGTPRDADVESATFWQGIRHRYESSKSETGLWNELTEVGMGYDRIEAAVLNPATLTNFVYGMPGPAMSAAMQAFTA